MLMSLARGVRCLLALPTSLLLERHMGLVGASMGLLTGTRSKWLRERVLSQELILRLLHLEYVQKLCILRALPLAVIPRGLYTIGVESRENLLNLLSVGDSDTTHPKRDANPAQSRIIVSHRLEVLKPQTHPLSLCLRANSVLQSLETLFKSIPEVQSTPLSHVLIF